MNVTIKQAGLFWGAVLRALGFAGIYAPNGRIYILKRYIDNETLRAHEIQHARQCERDGYYLFWFRIFWFLWKYGYTDSPYEIEARTVANGR